MRKLLLPLVGMALASGAALLAPRAEATLSVAPSDFRAAVGETSAVEQIAARCLRRRICQPGQGCHYRTVCKRLPPKTGPAQSGPGMM
jgi:hypothetical protein